MTWDGKNYVKIACEESKAKPVNEFLLANFKMINPSCDYPFFKENGTPNLWYAKSINGEYEYFTALDIHPVTSKSLKAITKYMIDTHICSKQE